MKPDWWKLRTQRLSALADSDDSPPLQLPEYFESLGSISAFSPEPDPDPAFASDHVFSIPEYAATEFEVTFFERGPGWRKMLEFWFNIPSWHTEESRRAWDDKFPMFEPSWWELQNPEDYLYLSMFGTFYITEIHGDLLPVDCVELASPELTAAGLNPIETLSGAHGPLLYSYFAPVVGEWKKL